MNEEPMIHYLNTGEMKDIIDTWGGLELGGKGTKWSSCFLPPLNVIASKAIRSNILEFTTHLNAPSLLINSKSYWKSTPEYWHFDISTSSHCSHFEQYSLQYPEQHYCIQGKEISVAFWIRVSTWEDKLAGFGSNHFLMRFTLLDDKIFYVISGKVKDLCECLHTDTVNNIIYQTFKE